MNSGTKPADDDKDSAGHDKEILAATRPFMKEQRGRSWWHLLSGVGLLVSSLYVGTTTSRLWVSLLFAPLSALMILRVFMLYHDFKHRAILRGSWVATAIMHVFGLLILAPPSVWKRSHNYHHGHTAKIVGSQLGSFPVMTDIMYTRANERRRLQYRFARHPLTMVAAYFTIFLGGMCIAPLLKSPRHHLDALLALVVHFGALALVMLGRGPSFAFLGLLVPHALACIVGAYLFYAQHNFPSMVLRGRHKWRYVDAALHASSFMQFAPAWRWFFANIGYHHVHHLNPSIPFYRLPEAMAAIPGLDRQPQTSLSPRDVVDCLRLGLWSHDERAMQGYPRASEGTTR
jgi:omega-6 fatty acid desaturase (delta-12 desaturase)